MAKPRYRHGISSPSVNSDTHAARLSRQQVTAAEIDGAISLLLRDQNIAAAHLCANAASKVMVGLRRHTPTGQTMSSALRHAITLHLPKHDAADLISKLDQDYNLLKHGNGDKDLTLEVSLTRTIGDIAMSAMGYFAIWGEVSPKMVAFHLWLLLSADKDLPFSFFKPVRKRYGSLVGRDDADRLAVGKSLLTAYDSNEEARRIRFLPRRKRVEPTPPEFLAALAALFS